MQLLHRPPDTAPKAWAPHPFEFNPLVSKGKPCSPGTAYCAEIVIGVHCPPLHVHPEPVEIVDHLPGQHDLPTAAMHLIRRSHAGVA